MLQLSMMCLYLMLKEKLDKIVLKKLNVKNKIAPDIEAWKEFLGKLKNPTTEITIGLVGKYNELPDAYKSIYESFIHAGAINECKVNVKPIHSEYLLEADLDKELKVDGVLVAPGFGERGIEGKIRAIKYVREHNIPFFGICLGMQCAAVEFTRNVLGLNDAASVEVNADTKDPVIHLMEDQVNITEKGGTMRLGSYDCKIKRGSLANKIYGKTKISERHRHRYEFNNRYRDDFENNGMSCSGINPETDLVEIIELKENDFFVGVQYHPELKSTVENPHPLFVSFVKASLLSKQKRLNEKT